MKTDLKTRLGALLQPNQFALARLLPLVIIVALSRWHGTCMEEAPVADALAHFFSTPSALRLLASVSPLGLCSSLVPRDWSRISLVLQRIGPNTEPRA